MKRKQANLKVRLWPWLWQNDTLLNEKNVQELKVSFSLEIVHLVEVSLNNSIDRCEPKTLL